VSAFDPGTAVIIVCGIVAALLAVVLLIEYAS
jgi:hypothetical protein